MITDVLEMLRAAGRQPTAKNVWWALSMDSFAVVSLTRARENARRFHVPGVNRLLRYVQMGIFGIEIGKNVELGSGVYFIHTLGIIIGGNAKIGDRVRFLGNNHVGNAKGDGDYPVIEDDVLVGAGARILGKVRIGKGAIIGANAVVLSDIPAGATAVGAPARAITKRS